MSEEEKALVDKYRETTDYADGYADGVNSRAIGSVSEAYDIGHRAGGRAAGWFAKNGLGVERMADGVLKLTHPFATTPARNTSQIGAGR